MATIIKCDLCPAQGDEVSFKLDLYSMREGKNLLLDVCKEDAEKIVRYLNVSFNETLKATDLGKPSIVSNK